MEVPGPHMSEGVDILVDPLIKGFEKNANVHR